MPLYAFKTDRLAVRIADTHSLDMLQIWLYCGRWEDDSLWPGVAFPGRAGFIHLLCSVIFKQVKEDLLSETKLII